MAEIVLGIGTSHGPMLVTETESWGLRVPADKANKHAWKGGTWTFDELVEARAGERLGEQTVKRVWDERQARCQQAGQLSSQPGQFAIGQTALQDTGSRSMARGRERRGQGQ